MSEETILSKARIEQLIAVYRDGLLQDTLPFWIEHAIDRQYGGYLIGLDQDGTVINTDKPMWVQGRFAWLLSTLYATVEPKARWLELAAHGIDFIQRFGFDTDGRMFFSVTRDGRPLRKRRYFFSETFAIMALAAFARATGDSQFAAKALDLFQRVVRYHTTPGLLEPKTIPQTRELKGLAAPMILIVTAQVLREATSDPMCD
jgi:N-acylglucosamine 2-epimerase